ncbi:MAG: SMI1/KNR4 family protein [Minicystis sp.]
MAAKKKTAVKKTMEDVLAGLAASPPKGKKAGATSFAKLEKLTEVPESLRALWSWSNGCEGLLRRFDAKVLPDSAWDDLFSVNTAAKVLALNLEADMEPHLIPFGGEQASGDCLVLDTKTGRVHYWDHEEGDVDPDPIAKSLPDLLARALDR